MLATAINIEIYGQLYTLMRGRTLLVNGVLVNKPYKSPVNDVVVSYNSGSIIFATKYLQVHWDGYEHIDLYLCKEYKAKVCGLCGNADGELELAATVFINYHIIIFFIKEIKIMI